MEVYRRESDDTSGRMSRTSDSPPKKRNIKKIILTAVVSVVVTAVIGFVAYLLLTPETSEPEVPFNGRGFTVTPEVITTERFAQFDVDEDGDYQCSLDNNEFEPCEFPLLYESLDLGEHTLVVVEGDSNVSSYSYRWTIIDSAE